MPAGRPPKYSATILKKAQEYLDSCVDEEYDWTKTDGDKSTSYEHRVKVKLPSVEGLARYLLIHRSTVYEWAKEHEEFSDILERILAEQAQRLMQNGLSGDYNPTIAKLILTKHGYSDKTEMTGKDDGPIEHRVVYLPQRNVGMETPPRKTNGSPDNTAE